MKYISNEKELIASLSCSDLEFERNNFKDDYLLNEVYKQRYKLNCK